MSNDIPPTLAEVCRASVVQHMLGVHTHLPGQVVSFDKSTQCAQVQCTLLYPERDEAGNVTGQARPIFDKVPVLMWGTGEYGMTAPVTAGDFVLLVFFEQSADRWLALGGTGVDPLDRDRHKMGAPVALAGLRTFKEPLDTLPDALVLRSPTTVLLGGNTATKEIPTIDAFHALMKGIALAISNMDAVSAPHPELTALQTALGSPPAGAATWAAGGMSAKARG